MILKNSKMVFAPIILQFHPSQLFIFSLPTLVSCAQIEIKPNGNTENINDSSYTYDPLDVTKYPLLEPTTEEWLQPLFSRIDKDTENTELSKIKNGKSQAQLPYLKNVQFDDFAFLIHRGYPVIIDDLAKDFKFGNWSCEEFAEEFPDVRMKAEYDIVENDMDRDRDGRVKLGDVKWISEVRQVRDEDPKNSNQPLFGPYVAHIKDEQTAEIKKHVQKYMGAPYWFYPDKGNLDPDEGNLDGESVFESEGKTLLVSQDESSRFKDDETRNSRPVSFARDYYKEVLREIDLNKKINDKHSKSENTNTNNFSPNYLATPTNRAFGNSSQQAAKYIGPRFSYHLVSFELWFSPGNRETGGSGAMAHNDGYCEVVISAQFAGQKTWRYQVMPEMTSVFDSFEEFDGGANRANKWKPELEGTVKPRGGTFFAPAMLHETRSPASCSAASTFQFRFPQPSRYLRMFLPRILFSNEVGRCFNSWDSFVTFKNYGSKNSYFPTIEREDMEVQAYNTFKEVDVDKDDKISLNEIYNYLYKNKKTFTSFAAQISVNFDMGTDDLWNAAVKENKKNQFLVKQNILSWAVDILVYHDVDDSGDISQDELNASVIQWNVARSHAGKAADLVAQLRMLKDQMTAVVKDKKMKHMKVKIGKERALTLFRTVLHEVAYNERYRHPERKPKNLTFESLLRKRWRPELMDFVRVGGKGAKNPKRYQYLPERQVSDLLKLYGSKSDGEIENMKDEVLFDKPKMDFVLSASFWER